MSALTDAFSSLLDAQEEATGARLKASIGKSGETDAIVEEINSDEVLIAGGTGDAGGFRIQVLASEFPRRPKFNESVKAGRHEAKVLTVTENNQILIITCGEPAANE